MLNQLDLSRYIGNTPLIEYKKNIFIKFEFMNYTGSIKDRPVYYIIKNAEGRKEIKPNQTTLVEATSGNTGISLATIGKLLGYRVKIIMPKDMSMERKKIIQSLGAELTLVEEGNFQAAIDLRNEICKTTLNHYNVNQFLNKENIECHYLTTGKEITNFFIKENIVPFGFICGTGTGGTFMGVSKRLKETYPDISCHVLEPYESSVMSGGKAGIHQIQGIGDGSKFLVDLKQVDGIHTIKSSDAIEKAKQISQKYGYFVGISSAANLLGAEILEKRFKKPIVTFFCDNGNRYLSMF